MNVKFFVLSTIILLFGVSGFAIGQDVELDEMDLVGQLAFVGDDHNIHTMDLSTGETVQLTDDGTRRASYEFPTWSKDGQLAYFCCSVRGSEPPRLTVFISPDGVTSGEPYYSLDGARHVYAYWSPQTCITDDCVDLAVLIQQFSRSRLGVELLNSHDPEMERQDLGEGTPFYYSWSPAGDSLLIHRNNRLLQYYSVQSTDVDTAFEGDLGSFLSPSWSPVDDRILFATRADEMTRITVIDDEQQRDLVDGIQGIVSFSWSPDGEYIAYRVANRDAISAVYVVDAETGDTIARSNVSGIISFFWSPDSEKIAYITLSNPPGTFDINNETVGHVTYLTQLVDGFAWNILNIEDSSNLLSASFIPTISMQYLLTNFDQFAQSHSIWSPDSRYLVYSERGGSDGRESLVSILDTKNINDLPVNIARGGFAIWSYK